MQGVCFIYYRAEIYSNPSLVANLCVRVSFKYEVYHFPFLPHYVLPMTGIRGFFCLSCPAPDELIGLNWPLLSFPIMLVDVQLSKR